MISQNFEQKYLELREKEWTEWQQVKWKFAFREEWKGFVHWEHYDFRMFTVEALFCDSVEYNHIPGSVTT